MTNRELEMFKAEMERDYKENLERIAFCQKELARQNEQLEKQNEHFERLAKYFQVK